MAEDKPDLSLPREAREKALSFLKEKRKLVCPVCGNTHLSVAEHMVSPVTLNQQGGQVLGGTTYPMVMVYCTNCYHVMFHLAVPMGVVPADAEGKSGG